MGDTRTELGAVSLIVDQTYIVDHRGWLLLDPLSGGTIGLTNADYIDAMIEENIDVVVGYTSHMYTIICNLSIISTYRESVCWGTSNMIFIVCTQ